MIATVIFDAVKFYLAITYVVLVIIRRVCK